MGCCECGSVGKTIVLGVCLTISFGLLIAAGVIPNDNSWLPMINLGAIVLVPMCIIISDTFGRSDSYDEGKQAWANFGACSLGVILASLLGLPVVLLKINDLSTTPFALWMASTGVTIGAAIWYWLARGRDKNGF